MRQDDSIIRIRGGSMPAPVSDTTCDSGSVSRSALVPTLAVIGAVLLWGGSFSAMKVAVSGLGPWTVMWVRMVLAVALLIPFARRLWPVWHRADLPRLAAMALCLPCGYFLFESNALRFTSSAQAGVIAALVPLLVAAGARIFLAERVPMRSFGGLALSLAGVAWLTLSARAGEHATAPLLGNGLELLAMICAAGYMLLAKELSTRYGSWTLTGLQSVAGLVFFLPGSVSLIDHPPMAWQPVEAFAVIYLGAGASLGAFGLYNFGISRLPASRASAFINLVPVAALLMGWGILGEALSPSQWAASAVVFGGVWLSQR
jgi:drug/metabolite transporter (DMT)-like permease